MISLRAKRPTDGSYGGTPARRPRLVDPCRGGRDTGDRSTVSRQRADASRSSRRVPLAAGSETNGREQSAATTPARCPSRRAGGNHGGHVRPSQTTRRPQLHGIHDGRSTHNRLFMRQPLGCGPWRTTRTSTSTALDSGFAALHGRRDTTTTPPPQHPTTRSWRGADRPSPRQTASHASRRRGSCSDSRGRPARRDRAPTPLTDARS